MDKQANDPLIINDLNGQKSCFSGRCMTILLIVFDLILSAILIASLVYIIRAYNKSKEPIPSPLDYLAQQYADALPDSYLPDHFRVDQSYYVPATNQYSRGTCWAFSTIYLLMTQYRNQGIKQGYLLPTEYVNFSVQAFVSHVGNYCRSHPTEKVCGYGGFLINTTNDNEVEALDYFFKLPELNLSTSIVPESVCPYYHTLDESTDFKCDNLADALKNNPIEFTIKKMTTVYDTRAVKQLLYKSQRPLGIGIPTSKLNFYVPCKDSEYENSKECVEHYYPCPYAQDGSYCYILGVSGRTGDGVFASSDYIERVVQAGGHAMNVVGYNDNYRYNDRLSPTESISTLHGAFILHNSWGPTPGHSIDFLVGKRTLENEEVMCPNHGNPLNWIPANYDQMIATKDYKQCGTDIKRIRGRGITAHSDLLNCTSSICGVGNKYLMLGNSDAETISLPNGLHRTKFMNVTDLNNIQNVSITYPFWALYQILKPVDEDFVQNDPFDCGFYALPYTTLDAYNRRGWNLFDNFKVSDIEIEFAPSSYARAPESNGKDLSYLNASTYTIPEVELDGPIPFDAIYKDL